MLVLSRKRGEKIQIGTDVTLAVIDVKGRRAKLGIDAPKSCPVVRGELWEAAPRSKRNTPLVTEMN